MDSLAKQKERRILRQRRHLRESAQEYNSSRVGSESIGTLQINLNLAGSELEFKKFEKLLGDSLQRVQSLRKGRTTRQPSQQRKQKGEYFFTVSKAKKQVRPPEVKNPKSSLLSSAETQLTDSGLYDEAKPAPSEHSYTVEYLLNENKHLKEQIQMILKSRSKLNETEHLVKTLAEYRKIISEQEAEISLLKKYHILLVKEGEKNKLEIAAKDSTIQVIKLELQKVKSQPGFEAHQTKLREMTQCPLRMDEITATMEKIRQFFRRSQSIQDLVNCLQKQIFWSLKQPGCVSLHPQSPRHCK